MILTGEEGSSRHVRVAAGERAELSCKAAGFPSPRITWSREDMHVLPSGRDSETSLRFVIQVHSLLLFSLLINKVFRA